MGGVPKDFSEDGAGGWSGGGLTADPATSAPDAWASAAAGAPSAPAAPAGIEGNGSSVGGADTYHVPYSTTSGGGFTYNSGGKYYRNAADAQNAGVYGALLGGGYANAAPSGSTAGTPVAGLPGGTNGGWGGGGLASMFEDGGEVPDGGGLEGDGGGDQNDPTGMQSSINEALKTVDDALSYGRKLHGFSDDGGGQQTAGNIPAAPASQSESGLPQDRPFPRLDPGANPFGRRQGGPQRMSANMPAVPASQSESGVPPQQPFPRLDPGSNPFGKRNGAPIKMGDAGQDQDQDQAQAQGIPADDDEEAA